MSRTSATAPNRSTITTSPVCGSWAVSVMGNSSYFRPRRAMEHADPGKPSTDTPSPTNANRDRALREHSRTTGEVAFEDVPDTQGRGLVLRDLSECLGPELMGEFQAWAARTHFWCELLAQFAYAITRYQQLKGLLPSAVEKTLAARETAPPPEGPDGSEITGIAVHATWRYVLEAMAVVSGVPPVPLLERGETILWPIRVIAVLMCPDASRHEAVREHCWAPILRHGEASVRQEVRDRLAQVFPDDRWFARFETPSSAPAAATDM
ncbi:hypothetical protein ABGB12_34555 [Actinocorallia sp. B10E7]|uniref:hypothetical protein n=1 Tax=Actinocorallia sp. B10E7 TaxID=3153558 RepID=UPI00325D4E79